MKKNFWAKLVSLALIILLTMGFVIEVAAESITMVRLEPSQATLVPGDNTTVQIRVDNAEDLFGYEVHLEFDPDLIQVVDSDQEKSGIQVSHGDVFDVEESFLVSNQVNNDEGTVLYAITQLAPAEAISGDGILFSLEVDAAAPGTSELKLTSVILASAEGISLPVETEDGQIDIQRIDTETLFDEGIQKTNKTNWGIVAGVSGVSVIGIIFALFYVKRKKQ